MIKRMKESNYYGRRRRFIEEKSREELLDMYEEMSDEKLLEYYVSLHAHNQRGVNNEEIKDVRKEILARMR